MATAISEKTLIPIGFVAILAGGIFWLSSLYIQTEANAVAIVEIKEEQRDERKEIIDRLNILDLKIDRILRRK